ncbi:hypothetical protein C7M84_023091 [Penaeus vannamei]|uniref:Uncharacterized protein n=1 Tax=Penaeus vannamei TaxID=6689 RepID=A0A423U4W7_PENVA|nr:hypothetical protein C7M84_023091 [Penaeus vannamei]
MKRSAGERGFVWAVQGRRSPNYALLAFYVASESGSSPQTCDQSTATDLDDVSIPATNEDLSLPLSIDSGLDLSSDYKLEDLDWDCHAAKYFWRWFLRDRMWPSRPRPPPPACTLSIGGCVALRSPTWRGWRRGGPEVRPCSGGFSRDRLREPGQKTVM